MKTRRATHRCLRRLIVGGLLTVVASCGGGGGGSDADVNAPKPFTTWANYVAQFSEYPAAMRTGVSYTVSGTVITPSTDPYFVNNGSESAPLKAIVGFDVNRRFSQLSLFQISYDLPSLGPGDRFMTLASIGQPEFDFAIRNSTFPGQSPFLDTTNNGAAIGLAANPFALGWDYQSFGVWDDVSLFGPQMTTATFGAPTPVSAVPTSGSATFTGKLGGLYVSAAGEGSVAIGDVTITADLGTRSLGFASTSTTTTRDLATAAPASNLDLKGSLAYDPASGMFSGTLSSASGTMSGQLTGKFYGAAGEEVGAVFTVRSSSTSELFIGAYGARR